MENFRASSHLIPEGTRAARKLKVLLKSSAAQVVRMPCRAVLVPESPDRIISFSSNLANGWRTVFLTVNSILRIHLFHGSGESQSLHRTPFESSQLRHRSVFSLFLRPAERWVCIQRTDARVRQRARAQMDLGVSDGLILDAVMMVVQRDKVALEAAGYSDLDTQSPMRTDAIFDI